MNRVAGGEAYFIYKQFDTAAPKNTLKKISEIIPPAVLLYLLLIPILYLRYDFFVSNDIKLA